MKVSFKRSEKELLISIREGDQRVMEKVYLKYRKEFVSWSIGKYGISEEDALDHYQDTATIFFEKVMNGSVSEISSSLKTYLFAIGKNRILQQFDEQNRIEKHEVSLAEHYHFISEDEGLTHVYEQARTRTMTMFNTLGDGCKEILKLFYFDKKSMSEIACLLGHKNEGVSRTTKKRCLEKLKNEVAKPLADG